MEESIMRLTYEVDGGSKVIYERGKDAYSDEGLLLKWLKMIYIGLGYSDEDIRRIFIDWLVNERMISSEDIEELKKKVSYRERELNLISSIDRSDNEFKIDECIHSGIGSLYCDIDKGIGETYKKMKIIE